MSEECARDDVVVGDKSAVGTSVRGYTALKDLLRCSTQEADRAGRLSRRSLT